MSNTAQDILDTILEKLHNMARTETVIGDPVDVGGNTILPVIKVSIGFGAGGGEGCKEESKSGKGTGGGGGGGASITPIGFIVVDEKGVRFMGTGKGKFETLFEVVPDLLRKFGVTKKEGKGGAEKERETIKTGKAEKK